MPKFKAIISVPVICVVSIMVYWFLLRDSTSSVVVTDQREMINQDLQDRVKKIHAEERHQAETLWADEYLAQRFGRSIERWWDRINASSPKIKALGEIGNDISILMSHWISYETIPHLNLERFRSTGGHFSYSSADWKSFIEKSIQDGWVLEHLEFRHIKFNRSETNIPHVSEFFFRAGISNKINEQKCLLTGPLVIRWNNNILPQGDFNQILQIDASQLEFISTTGSQPFKLIHHETISPPENADAIDPLLVHDIDGDGVSEIVLANKNKLLRYHPDGYFTSSPLCTFHPGLLSTAVFADLNGDGIADFLCHKQEGLVVVPGAANGLFDQYEIMLRPSDKQTNYPMVLSVGDVDLDDDLDIFLGQYRVPYQGGALPTPFYDANDGHPFFLLKNHGDWKFEDMTNTAIPNARQHRRIYSASLVDIDGNNGLDLIVVSDFAGTDLYLNDGKGEFHDATESLGDHYGFGMAHSLSDFNVDGKLDLLMIGMTSPTVDRLEHFGIWREGLTSDHSLRSRLAHGNRLFLSSHSQSFKQNKLSFSIASAGWAWGCSSADFDNNGYPDVIIGNGLETRQFVQDYESEYWLHDAFIANSEPDSAAYLYFKEKFAQTRGKGHSYGGYESNRLFLNFAAESFLEIGFLWGLGLQRDTRNVVAEDFDGDGRMDCLFTHFEAWPDENQVLRIYQNQLESNGNWVGFRINSTPNAPSPVGVSIRVESETLTKTDSITTGDSYRSQHSHTLHFGLGKDRFVKAAIVRWPNGKQLQIKQPEINRYHEISYPLTIAINDKE